MEKDSLFEIKTIEQIRISLPRSKNKYGIPKSVSFVFQELYKDIVTSIITTENHCRLYSLWYARSISREERVFRY